MASIPQADDFSDIGSNEGIRNAGGWWPLLDDSPPSLSSGEIPSERRWSKEKYSTTSWTPLKDPEMLVSTKFHSRLAYGIFKPNFHLISEDGVIYHVHRQALCRFSDNMFNHIFQNPVRSYAILPEKSTTLSIILYAIYDMSFSQSEFRPSFKALLESVAALPRYGLSPRHFVRDGTHLYAKIRDEIPLSPLLVYAFAAMRNLEDLAVAASPYLLSCDLRLELSDDIADLMGADYLKRLYDLQSRRKRQFTEMLLQPLVLHKPHKRCTYATQMNTMCLWRMATAKLILEWRPEPTCATIHSAYESAKEKVKCSQCAGIIVARVKGMTIEWTEQKV